MYETFCENCSHFALKWFQPNFFEKVCFLEERYENMQKIQILKILRAPSNLFDIKEYQHFQSPYLVKYPWHWSFMLRKILKSELHSQPKFIHWNPGQVQPRGWFKPFPPHTVHCLSKHAKRVECTQGHPFTA